MSRPIAALAGSAAVALLLPSLLSAQQPLPKPRTEGGKPLMQALAERATNRSFSPAPLPAQTMSDLLWAAAGINRPESGKRTTPSARNFQEVDVYVATADGLFLYEPKAHVLKLVVKEDLRGLTGTQDFVKVAPVNLIYVSDAARMGNTNEQDQLVYPAIAAGAMVQDVYLYAASAGLATVVRALVNREALGKAMQLRPEQRVVICQTVGLPAGS
ncbi:MAG: SagB/ThcOx family dehydrogenase [Gemmatimonadetes bacterium]|nr:SagB/ThcOx family dehydrogenase [Gemmatimonadota bacterium]